MQIVSNRNILHEIPNLVIINLPSAELAQTVIKVKSKGIGIIFSLIDCSIQNQIQSTLVISTSLILNKRLSRTENLVLVSTTGNKILWKRGEIAPQEQFLLFSTIFS